MYESIILTHCLGWFFCPRKISRVVIGCGKMHWQQYTQYNIKSFCSVSVLMNLEPFWQLPLTSRIERKYCLISTSCLAGLSAFSYYVIFNIIVCVLVSFPQWGHFVMLIIRNLNLISFQSWKYLAASGNKCA